MLCSGGESNYTTLVRPIGILSSSIKYGPTSVLSRHIGGGIPPNFEFPQELEAMSVIYVIPVSLLSAQY